MRISAEDWAELVQAWESSGKVAAKFAEEHGVSESSLVWWKGELARRARQERPRRGPRARHEPARATALVRVVRQSERPPPQAATAVVVVVGSARIVVQPGFDATLLRAVVGALGETT